MSPSKNVRRVGVVATGTFLLAMAASPAYAGLTPSLPLPVLGSTCTALTTLPTTQQCLNGIVTAIPLPVPVPAPTTRAPAPVIGTTPAPNPVGGLLGTVGGTVGGLGQAVGGLGSTVTGTGGGVTGGSLPSGTGTVPGTTTGKSTGSKGKSTPTTAQGAKGSTDGSSLLGPAAAFLPGLGITNFADLSFGDPSLSPLADNIPSPLIASPESKLAAVQAPLIAAGERASRKADSVFARFGGQALPGILVVLGTALVAAVGAGNLRTWQAKIADKRAKDSA